MTKDEVERWVKTGDQMRDPLGPDNRCKDFDEDCEGVCDKLHCWLHDPTQGWCPYLLGRA